MADARTETRKVLKWVEADEETVVLTLSRDEAETLRGVCSRIGGRGEDRNNMDSISAALSSQDIRGHEFDLAVPEGHMSPGENSIYIYGRK